MKNKKILAGHLVFSLLLFAGAAAFFFDGQNTQGATVTVSATVGSSVTCSTATTTTAFGTLTTGAVSTSTPNASSTLSCNTALGCTLNISDAGNGSSPGLATTSPAYLIASADTTLSAGTEGYGVQSATTTTGTGIALGLNSKYRVSGNQVGGLTTSTTVLASSTGPSSNREVVVTHKAAVGGLTPAGTYVDTITYACTGN
jgi:hypothetical protein